MFEGGAAVRGTLSARAVALAARRRRLGWGLGRASSPPAASERPRDTPRAPSELPHTSDGKQIKMGGGGKIPYPKHVWSPSGGWYAQPANWRSNTLIAGVVMAGVLAVTWKFSAEREKWTRKPEAGEWFPSRNWSRQLIEWDNKDRIKAESSNGTKE